MWGHGGAGRPLSSLGTEELRGPGGGAISAWRFLEPARGTHGGMPLPALCFGDSSPAVEPACRSEKGHPGRSSLSSFNLGTPTSLSLSLPWAFPSTAAQLAPVATNGFRLMAVRLHKCQPRLLPGALQRVFLRPLLCGKKKKKKRDKEKEKVKTKEKDKNWRGKDTLAPSVPGCPPNSQGQETQDH